MDADAAAPRSAVLDLRQYTLVPGARDTLIDVFDRHFVDGQHDVGIHVVGQFRDLDDPDRFVWLRGFESMAARGAALPAFYGGPVWRAHRDTANATMVDSDDALLLEPRRLGPRYPRFGDDAPATSEALVAVTVAHLDRPLTAADLAVADRGGEAMAAAGADVVAVHVTHRAPNNFPALPLRDENVIVWTTRFDDAAAHRAFRDRLASSPRWTHQVQPALDAAARAPMQWLRLQPTARSQLR